MSTADLLERGRVAYDRMAWRAAYEALSAADREVALSPDDLERLATLEFLLGRDEAAEETTARLHREVLQAGDELRAARAAFWIAFSAFGRGNVALGSGWLARAERLLEGRPPSVEHGFVQLPMAIQRLDAHDWTTALEHFDRIAAIGERFGNADLATVARLGRGEALIGMGERARGVALLDEAMVAVTSGEVSPTLVGTIYCATVEVCHRVFDIRRAQEWTDALDRWVAAQPDLVPFRGECLVYRAELLLLHGIWAAAEHEAREAHAHLIGPPPKPAVGDALYQQGELHRLAGRFAEAERAYRDANRLGRRPEPGLALLRLAQGRTQAAASALRRALDETDDRLGRPRLLAAWVDVLLDADDVEAAATIVAELKGIASEADAPMLLALADRAEGALALARGDGQAALSALRRAARAWSALGAPYESARVSVLIGLACRALGDDDTGRLELDAAAAVFRDLGAAPDLARVERLTAAPRTAGGLTSREVEILRLVATGRSNRAIASELVISEKTVARHLSNIFTKLDLPSRAAATAYAYEHDLVEAR